MDINKIRKHLPKYITWKIILDSIPEDTILFLDIEVYPLVEKEISNKHKIIAVACLYRNKERIFIGEEKKILKEFNEFLGDKEIYLTAGYGSLYLDVPMILLKLRIYRNLYKLREIFSIVPHLDLIYPASLLAYAENKMNKLTLLPLVEFSKLYNLNKKQKFTEELYNDNKKLKEYMLNDIRTIYNVYKIIRGKIL